MIVVSSIHYPAILSSYNPSKKETAANRPPFPYQLSFLFFRNYLLEVVLINSNFPLLKINTVPSA
jgi:hypothetical protein